MTPWIVIGLGIVAVSALAPAESPWPAVALGAVALLTDVPHRLASRWRELRAPSPPPRGAILVLPSEPRRPSTWRSDLVTIAVFVALGLGAQALGLGGGAWWGVGLALGSQLRGVAMAVVERRARQLMPDRTLAEPMLTSSTTGVCFVSEAQAAFGR